MDRKNVWCYPLTYLKGTTHEIEMGQI